MKITVLEHPRVLSEKHFNDIANTPLWSCLMGGYVAAALKKNGREVTFIDCTVNRWDFGEATDRLMENPPDLLAVNTVYIWENTGLVFDFLTELRRRGFGGHINLFGFYPTLASETIMDHAGDVDSVALGECEDTLVELAAALGRGDALSAIKGLSVRRGDTVTRGELRAPASDPDIFDFPMRAEGGFSTASILGSRGCYNHCSFCPVPSFYNRGPLWRGRSPENIVREIKMLMESGIRDFYFSDPNFIGPGKRGKRRTLELMEMIRPLGITFGMETRPGDLDEEIMESLTASGFKSMLLGIESGSPDLLGKMSKGSTLNSSERAIALCRKFGVEPEVGFLMFVPDSRLEDLSHNLAFLKRNRLLDRLERTANLFCHCHIVLMGTTGYERYLEADRLCWSGFNGFEGEINYVDERVEWMREVVVFACHHVLREMGRTFSPINWQIASFDPPFSLVNDYLIEMFENLLDIAGKTTQPPDPESLRIEICRDIDLLIGNRTE